MPSLKEIVHNFEERHFGSLRTTAGTITGVSQGQYTVAMGAHSVRAVSTAPGRFKAGDRVVMLIGQGAPQIIGLQAKDENA